MFQYKLCEPKKKGLHMVEYAFHTIYGINVKVNFKPLGKKAIR